MHNLTPHPPIPPTPPNPKYSSPVASSVYNVNFVMSDFLLYLKRHTYK